MAEPGMAEEGGCRSATREKSGLKFRRCSTEGENTLIETAMGPHRADEGSGREPAATAATGGRLQSFAWLGLAACFALPGCAVVAVADAAVTVTATAVATTAKVVGAGVDLVLPDGDEEEGEGE
jgi:hypothetical protein